MSTIQRIPCATARVGSREYLRSIICFRNLIKKTEIVSIPHFRKREELISLDLTLGNVDKLFYLYLNLHAELDLTGTLESSSRVAWAMVTGQQNGFRPQGSGDPPPAYEVEEPEQQRSHPPTRHQLPAPPVSHRSSGTSHPRNYEPSHHPSTRYEPGRSSGAGRSQGSRRSYAERPSRHYGQPSRY